MLYGDAPALSLNQAQAAIMMVSPWTGGPIASGIAPYYGQSGGFAMYPKGGATKPLALPELKAVLAARAGTLAPFANSTLEALYPNYDFQMVSVASAPAKDNAVVASTSSPYQTTVAPSTPSPNTVVTPQQAVAVATTPGANKQGTYVDTYAAALKLVTAIAPLLTPKQKDVAAKSLVGKKVYSPPSSSYIPLILVGVGIFVVGAVLVAKFKK